MIGKTVSHYRILDKIGAGGMGTVYKAEDTRLRRPVALKFLSPVFDDPDARTRFLHEARAAASLNHPHIATVYEIDEYEGRIFFAMEYIEGQTLGEKISQRPMDMDEALNIAIQIAGGLGHAHARNIVHRDIKPANILLTSEGRAKIVDFGVAKLPEMTQVTRQGSTPGTIAYMSPEQTRGDAVDARTDIWALGVVLYEMVTGKQPFRGAYDQAVIYSILNEEIEPPGKWRSGLPPMLESILNRALAKKGEERYSSAGELAADLNRLIQDGGVEKAETGKPREQRKRIKRGPLLPILIPGILVLLGAVSIGLIRHGTGKPAGPVWRNSIAVLPFVDMSPGKDQEYFCDGMTEQILTNLSRLNPLKVIARTSVMQYKNTTKQIPEIGKELNVAYVLEGSLRKYGNAIRVTAQLISVRDGFHVWSEDFDRDLQNIFQLQEDISSAIALKLIRTLSPEDRQQIKGYKPKNVDAYEYYLRGRYYSRVRYFGGSFESRDFEMAENLLKKAIELDSTYALSYAELAELYNTYTANNLRSAPGFDRYIRLQKTMIDKAIALNPNLSEIYLIRSGIESFQGDKDAAMESVYRAYQMEPERAETIFFMGRLYHNINQYERAIENFDRAIRLDPQVSFYYTKRAWTRYRLGRLAEAEADFKQALNIEENSLIARYEYFVFLISTGRIQEAEALQLEGKGPAAVLSAAAGDKDSALKDRIFVNFKLIVYLLLNMKSEALDLMETYQTVDLFWWDDVCVYKTFDRDPLFDGMRKDPRFKAFTDAQKNLFNRYEKKYGA